MTNVMPAKANDIYPTTTVNRKAVYQIHCARAGQRRANNILDLVARLVLITIARKFARFDIIVIGAEHG